MWAFGRGEIGDLMGGKNKPRVLLAGRSKIAIPFKKDGFHGSLKEKFSLYLYVLIRNLITLICFSLKSNKLGAFKKIMEFSRPTISW